MLTRRSVSFVPASFNGVVVLKTIDSLTRLQSYTFSVGRLLACWIACKVGQSLITVSMPTRLFMSFVPASVNGVVCCSQDDR